AVVRRGGDPRPRRCAAAREHAGDPRPIRSLARTPACDSEPKRGGAMTRELAGKVALVTGGGRGLGQAICETLAKAGATAVSGDVRFELADAVAAGICRCGGDAMPLRLDVADEAAARDAMRKIEARYGQLDVLVNNAGVDVTTPIDEMSVADWDRIIAINLRGPFVMSRLALGEMKPRGSGHIVNVVSTAAKRAWADA